MGTQVVVRTRKSPRKVPQSAKTKMTEVQDSRGILPPMWGIVEEAFSQDNTVTVQLQTGLVLRHVDVLSREWGGANNERGYGEQDLPPKGAEVLVVFPNNLIEEAFVIGSKLETLGEMGDKQSAELLKAGQERKHTRVVEIGWKLQYDKDTGDFTVESPDTTDKIVFSVDRTNKKVKVSVGAIDLEITNGQVNVAGDTKSLVTYSALNTALQGLVTAINTTFGTKLDGGGTTGTLSLDIGAAEAQKAKTG